VKPPATLQDLETAIGCAFQSPAILQQSLVHRSYLHERPEYTGGSNERLEFLGDAWLNYVVADELYRRLPDQPEGVLTKLRAALVQRDTLAAIARSLDLGSFMLMGRGEESTEGRTRPSNLSRTLEAVIGAILNDRGEAEARRFVWRLLEESFEEALAGRLGTDYKSALLEACQAQRREGPVFHVIGASGPPHAPRFTVTVSVDAKVLGTGSGANLKSAEREAARLALEVLRSEASG